MTTTESILGADDLEIIEEFIEESLDSLAVCDGPLDALAQHPEEVDPVHAIFRPMHSIKGNSAFLGLFRLREVAHEIEGLLSAIRNRELFPGPTQIKLVRLGIQFVVVLLKTIRSQHQEIVDEAAMAQLIEAVRNRNQLPEDLIPVEDNADTETSSRTPASAETVLFNRALLIVRETSRQTGKLVNLVMTGEDLKVPRAIATGLETPLMHVLRNAVDHGIESPDERQAAGKPPEGRITLKAEMKDQQLCVMITDNGRGLNLKAIHEKAIAAGIVTVDQSLSPQAVAELVFHPGLSTAEKVTDVSGRGVGMDAVKAAVETLGGTVRIVTKPGQGTALRLDVPLPATTFP